MISASDPNTRKWDLRFLSLAKHISQWSKDPSTKVGSVIVDSARRIVSMGYNGFPAGFPDTPELYADRQKKYARVVHAEMNAILNAPGPFEFGVLYVWPLFSCGTCAKHVAQTNIYRIVTPEPNEERFASEYEVAKEIYKECNIIVDHYRLDEIV